MIDSVIWQTLEMADLYAKGLPPIAGGALDQAQAFVDAVRYIWTQEARIKRELGIVS